MKNPVILAAIESILEDLEGLRQVAVNLHDTVDELIDHLEKEETKNGT